MGHELALWVGASESPEFVLVRGSAGIPQGTVRPVCSSFNLLPLAQVWKWKEGRTNSQKMLTNNETKLENIMLTEPFGFT